MKVCGAYMLYAADAALSELPQCLLSLYGKAEYIPRVFHIGKIGSLPVGTGNFPYTGNRICTNILRTALHTAII